MPLGYETIGDWLDMPEISMARATYDRLVRLHRTLIVQRTVEPERLYALDYARAAIVLPRLDEGNVTTEDAINDVEILGEEKLREKYRLAA